MSFSFDFVSSSGHSHGEMDEDPLGLGEDTSSVRQAPLRQEFSTVKAESVPSRTLALNEILASLPDRISYSFVRIPSIASSSSSSSSNMQVNETGHTRTQDFMPRRDLFDARFQILHERLDERETEVGKETAHSRREDVAVVGTESDLVPGLYEGGLKTWQCSVDLVGILDSIATRIAAMPAQPSPFVGTEDDPKSIVELGCGTALPTAYLLQHLLRFHISRSSDANSKGPIDEQPRPITTHLHLCDYNIKVLELVTLPNLLLAYRFVKDPQAAQPSPSLSVQAGELDLSSEFVSAFVSDLRSAGVQLHFHSGPWGGLHLRDNGRVRPASITAPSTMTTTTTMQVDLILTSETTYNLQGVRDLIDVVKRLSRSSPGRLTTSTDGTSPVSEEDFLNLAAAPDPPTLCLVSTKDYYFGLGGGMMALQQTLHESSTSQPAQPRPWTRVLREFKVGVARTVLCLGWS